MSADTAEDLNYDCNYNLFLAKTLLKNLTNAADRERAGKWMRMLATCNQNIAEMKLRNEFVYYLILNIQSYGLKPPFTEDPPAGPLSEIANLLPQATESAANLEAGGPWGARGAGASQRPFLYQNSPDGGAFLAAQPIPRCGAFCYLAVVSRSKN